MSDPRPVDVDASYRMCDVLARRKARNFYYGFMLLPRARRLALSAMYAYFRACDDIADGDGTPAERGLALQAWRQTTHDALGTDAAVREAALAANPILVAFRDAVERYAIPIRCFLDLLDGAVMDLDTVAYETFDDLYRYCYRVASTVGLVCVHVFGFDGSAEALQMAEWCGIGFQITNILRDVEEDAGLGRIYLPQEDLRRYGISGDEVRRGTSDVRFRGLMAFEAARARDFYERSADLAGHVLAESRPALAALVSIYRRLLDKIEKEDYRVYGRRVSLSKGEKLGLLARAFLMSRLPGWATAGVRSRRS